MYQRYCELRDKKGVTDYQAATETEITRSTFTDWKAGVSQPKIDKLYKIANYFGVPLEYFVAKEDK